MRGTRDLHAVGAESGAGDDRVAQLRQAHRGSVTRDRPVEIERDRCPALRGPSGVVLHGVTLLRLDCPGRRVEMLGDRVDLRHRAGDAQRGGAVVTGRSLQDDVAQVLGTGPGTLCVVPRPQQS